MEIYLKTCANPIKNVFIPVSQSQKSKAFTMIRILIDWSPRHLPPLVTGLVLCLLASTANAQAREPIAPAYVHVVYGYMTLEKNDPDVSGGDYNQNLFGLTGQVPYGGSRAQYGLEYGALLSLQSETRSIVVTGGGSGGSINVSVDINAFLLDGFFGGYVSLQPLKWMRFYLGAGPLLIYGERTSESAEPAPEPYASTRESALGAGLYARGGVDIIFTDRFAIGAALRGTQTSLSFKEAGGKVDVEGWQYFIAMSFRY